MDTASLSWNVVDRWQSPKTQFAPNLVLYFGSRETLSDSERFRELREMFPDACLMGCSTDGQICGDEIIESGVNAIAVRFDATTLRAAIESVPDASRSRITVRQSAGGLPPTISPASSYCQTASP